MRSWCCYCCCPRNHPLRNPGVWGFSDLSGPMWVTCGFGLSGSGLGAELLHVSEALKGHHFVDLGPVSSSHLWLIVRISWKTWKFVLPRSCHRFCSSRSAWGPEVCPVMSSPGQFLSQMTRAPPWKGNWSRKNKSLVEFLYHHNCLKNRSYL